MPTAPHTVVTDPVEPNPDQAAPVTAIVVPHTHWDREWYAPFQTMRFHLVRFFDELLRVLESETDLPTFLLDGQTVMLEDYLQIRPQQRPRLEALIAAGRLRPGPNYVQPDEFHVSGEAIVRNFQLGIAMAGEFGWVTREGYLPDTFGHVHQLPQILRGFGMETFYAMRGFSADPEELGSEFWWLAPDGSRVLVEWLTESYSNAAMLNPDPQRMELHHSAIVRYDSLQELLDRMVARTATGALLLLNGGDHLHVQQDLVATVGSMSSGSPAEVRLGSLEEFHQLVMSRPLPTTEISGELRSGRLHAVFDGIGSTRTPLKRLNERTESHLSGVAERLDVLATLVDGLSSADALRFAWRELIKNYAHDSICGCSVDEVHEEMVTRFTTIGQLTATVAEEALGRIGAVAPAAAEGEFVVLAVNPSGFVRTGMVSVEVLPDPDAPVGERHFGWLQSSAGADLSTYTLVGPTGRAIPFSLEREARLHVADALVRRKETLLDRLTFVAEEVPALGSAAYRLVRATAHGDAEPGEVSGDLPGDAGDRGTSERVSEVAVGDRWLDNGIVRVAVEADGTLTLADHRTGRVFGGLLSLIDEADAGDEYGFGPLPGDHALALSADSWQVDPGLEPGSLRARAVFAVPEALAPDRSRRSTTTTELGVDAVIGLTAASDQVSVDLTIANGARDHRLTARFATGLRAADSLAETAFGTIRRDGSQPDVTGWQERPTGALAMRRFVAVQDEEVGLQVLAEGLYEYYLSAPGTVDLTVVRSVGWMSRVDHALRPHKVGPQIATPGAQCLGRLEFRLALRPYAAASGVAGLYRAAEEFSVPLQAVSPWGRAAATPRSAAHPLGLQVGPEEVVLSAVKAAEDRNGIVVRVFNCEDSAVTAVLRPGFPLARVERITLEETPAPGLTARLDDDGSVHLPLAAAQIATVRLVPLPAPAIGAQR